MSEDEHKKEEWVGLGSPTEVALVVLGAKVGLTRESLAGDYQMLREFPFDSTIKRMSRIFLETGTNNMLILKIYLYHFYFFHQLILLGWIKRLILAKQLSILSLSSSPFTPISYSSLFLLLFSQLA